MYNEYKAAEYNAEMNESRKHSNGRWGNCGRFLADALIQLKQMNNFLFLKQLKNEYQSVSLPTYDV